MDQVYRGDKDNEFMRGWQLERKSNEHHPKAIPKVDPNIFIQADIDLDRVHEELPLMRARYFTEIPARLMSRGWATAADWPCPQG